MRHAGIWRMGTRLPGCCGLMAAMCVMGMVRSTRRLTACDVVAVFVGQWMVPLLSSSTEWWIFPLQMPVVSPLFLTGAVLGQGCCLPVVFTPVRTVQTVQKTRILQRSSGWLSTCPLVCILQGFGQTVEKTGVPQLHSSDKWSMSLVRGLRRFSGASVEETVVSHSCSR